MTNNKYDDARRETKDGINKSIKELVTSLRQQNKLLSEYFQKMENHQSQTTKKD